MQSRPIVPRPAVPFAGFGFAAASLLTLAATADDGDWPSFRGPDRTGVSAETGLLTRWPEGGPRLLWETAGAGRGYASLAIVGDSIYTLGDGPSVADDEDEYLSCFDRDSGQPRWRLKTGPAWDRGQESWQGSRSTPTVDGDRVYVITPFGELVCASTDGRELWRRHLMEEFQGRKADSWGYSESVLIDGDRLVCTPGGPEKTMVALNKLTGDELWSAARDEDRGAGHASVVVAEVGGTRVYVQTTGSGALGVRADDGRLLWGYEIDKTTAVIPTPIVRDDLVFFAAGYRRGGALLRQIPDGDGIRAEEVYPLDPQLANKHGGIVRVGDYLYGDSDDQGIPFCAEFLTGEQQWKSRGSGRRSASIVAADGHLYIRYSDGTMTLVEATPVEMREVGSFKIPDSGDPPSWSHPVVLQGRLYLREDDRILCYDVARS